MPTYEYQCKICDKPFEDFRAIYARNNRGECPHCNAVGKHPRVMLTPPRIEGDIADWSNERDAKTGLNGRYCPQAAKFSGDKRAVFKSRSDFVEWGKRNSMSVTKD